jgi:hypothetical protein
MRGHPVGFSAELLGTHQPSRRRERAPLVARYPAIGIEVDDPGVLIDVDTEADLDAVRRAQQHGKRRRSGCDSAQREGELLEPLDLAVADPQRRSDEAVSSR